MSSYFVSSVELRDLPTWEQFFFLASHWRKFWDLWKSVWHKPHPLGISLIRKFNPMVVGLNKLFTRTINGNIFRRVLGLTESPFWTYHMLDYKYSPSEVDVLDWIYDTQPSFLLCWWGKWGVAWAAWAGGLSGLVSLFENRSYVLASNKLVSSGLKM